MSSAKFSIGERFEPRYTSAHLREITGATIERLEVWKERQIVVPLYVPGATCSCGDTAVLLVPDTVRWECMNCGRKIPVYERYHRMHVRQVHLLLELEARGLDVSRAQSRELRVQYRRTA